MPAHPLTTRDQLRAPNCLSISVGPAVLLTCTPGFTFAPLMAITFNCQPLLVLIYSDHTRLLRKLRQRDALGQDHVDLPPFYIQVSPVPDVDILPCQSRLNITTSTAQGRDTSKAGGRGKRLHFPVRICSLLLVLHLPALPPRLHCKVVPHIPRILLTYLAKTHSSNHTRKQFLLSPEGTWRGQGIARWSTVILSKSLTLSETQSLQVGKGSDTLSIGLAGLERKTEQKYLKDSGAILLCPVLTQALVTDVYAETSAVMQLVTLAGHMNSWLFTRETSSLGQ